MGAAAELGELTCTEFKAGHPEWDGAGAQEWSITNMNSVRKLNTLGQLDVLKPGTLISAITLSRLTLHERGTLSKYCPDDYTVIHECAKNKTK